jgi:hypothetical protein
MASARAKPHDHFVERNRNNHALEAESQRRGDEQVRALLRPGFPAHRHGQQDSLGREDIEHRENPVLVEKRKARDQHHSSQQVRHVIGVIQLRTSRVT